MAEKKPKLWLRIIGYAAFALFALVLMFFVTFPYDALKDRARMAAESSGYFLRIGSMGPGFFSVRAKNVEISKLSNADPPPESLKLDSVSVGPSLFPPGVAVNVKVLGGSIGVKASAFGAQRVKVDLDGLDLAKGNVKGFSGIDFSGQIDGHADLTLPRASTGEPDLTQATGTITLNTTGLAINGGTANITIPQFGPEPTPMDLPKIAVGDLTGKVKLDKGVATVDELASKSSDLELKVNGTVKLAKRLDYSEPALEVRLKPDPEFQKRLGLLGSALSMIGADPKDPTWRLGRVSGYVGRPQWR